MLLLGVLAGVFIGLGAHADITVMQTLKNVDVGFMKLLGAAVFPVGLMLVVVAGAELFTGNNLMSLALMRKKITLGQLLRNWGIVYVGNFIGSVALVAVVVASALYGHPGDLNAAGNLAVDIAGAKVSLPFGAAFYRGILCNMLVVLAVWLASAAQDVGSKILAIWFPIMLFVLSGFEHSIANMYFIPLGKALGLQVSWEHIWLSNLIPVTLGNIVGGAIVIPLIYHLCYRAGATPVGARRDEFESSKSVAG